MSVAQFISYQPVQFINEFWRNLGHQAQVFYDRGKDTFCFRSSQKVFLMNKNNFLKITQLHIPYDGPILAMLVHQEQKFVVFQTDQVQLNIFSLRLNKQSIYRIPKTDKPAAILHFEWVYQPKGAVDFFIVETGGVRLFKIDDEKSGLKDIKFVQQKVSSCWFEPRNEVLPGVMQTYFFNERRKDNKYRGTDFVLEDPEANLKLGSSRGKQGSFQNQTFLPPGDQKNLDISGETQCMEQPHRIYLVNLYSKSYLLYSNSFTGKIVFYHLTFDKILKQPFLLAFPSDIMVNLSVFDNLIVLSAIHERISIVFDIKKQKPDSPIGPPQAIEPEIQPATVQYPSSKPDPDQQDDGISNLQSEYPQATTADENPLMLQTVNPSAQLNVPPPNSEQNEVQFGFDFEGFFQELRESEKEKRLRDHFVVKMKWTVRPIASQQQLVRETEFLHPSQIYDKSCNYLEDEFIIDSQHNLLFQFNHNLSQLPRLLDDDLESFLALLRRSNSKQNVFEYLRELVARNRQIMIFSLLYKHIFEIFSRSIHERNQRQEQSSIVEPPGDKLKNGYTVLYPLDFYQSFFQPLQEQPSKYSRIYVIELLVEFIRQFMDNLKEHRVLVPSQIQNLLIKLLVKENRMSYVHFLLQYQILSDSVDFAKLLVEISSKETLEAKKLLGKYQVYEPAFQMGTDMLHRMQRYDEMVEIFLKRGMFAEAAYLLRKQNINIRIRIQPVIEGANRPGIQYTREEIIALFDDIQRRSKGDKLGFTTEELKSLLAN